MSGFSFYNLQTNNMFVQIAGERSGKTFPPCKKDEQQKLMLEWAFKGFQPGGAEGLKPPEITGKRNSRPIAMKLDTDIP